MGDERSRELPRLGAVHKLSSLRHAICANFDPRPSVTLCHTSRDPTQKYVTHLGPPPPIFSRPSAKNPDKSPLYKFSLNCSRVFYPGFCLLSGRFCPGCLLCVPPSARMHVLQQKIKHHLKFHVSYV